VRSLERVLKLRRNHPAAPVNTHPPGGSDADHRYAAVPAAGEGAMMSNRNRQQSSNRVPPRSFLATLPNRESEVQQPTAQGLTEKRDEVDPTSRSRSPQRIFDKREGDLNIKTPSSSNTNEPARFASPYDPAVRPLPGWRIPIIGIRRGQAQRPVPAGRRPQAILRYLRGYLGSFTVSRSAGRQRDALRHGVLQSIRLRSVAQQLAGWWSSSLPPCWRRIRKPNHKNEAPEY